MRFIKSVLVAKVLTLPEASPASIPHEEINRPFGFIIIMV
jgi:hypothetical protein